MFIMKHMHRMQLQKLLNDFLVPKCCHAFIIANPDNLMGSSHNTEHIDRQKRFLQLQLRCVIL